MREKGWRWMKEKGGTRMKEKGERGLKEWKSIGSIGRASRSHSLFDARHKAIKDFLKT